MFEGMDRFVVQQRSKRGEKKSGGRKRRKYDDYLNFGFTWIGSEDAPERHGL